MCTDGRLLKSVFHSSDDCNKHLSQSRTHSGHSSHKMLTKKEFQFSFSNYSFLTFQDVICTSGLNCGYLMCVHVLSIFQTSLSLPSSSIEGVLLLYKFDLVSFRLLVKLKTFNLFQNHFSCLSVFVKMAKFARLLIGT